MLYEHPLLEQDDSSISDEDLKESNQWYASAHICAGCQECLTYTDEIFLLCVSESEQRDGQIVTSPITDASGEYRFPPLILHIECLEELMEQVYQLRGDEPPVECMNGIIFCDSCSSTIGPLEPYVTSTFGELHVSQRRPNGESTDTIEQLSAPTAICMACMVYVVQDYLEDWDDLLEALEINFPVLPEDEDMGDFE